MGRDNRRPRRLGKDDHHAGRTIGERRDQAALAAAYDREWSASQTGQPYHTFWRFHPSARDAVESALGPLAGQHILELGAGDGFSTLRLARRGARVIALELSHGGLRTIGARAATAGFAATVAPLRADAQQLPLAGTSVDLVYGENFLMYVDPAKIGSEAARVLKPGGRAVFLEPTAHHPFIRLYRRFGSPYRGTAPRYFTLADIIQLGAHFGTVTHHGYYLSSVLALPLAAYPLLFALAFRSLNRLDRLIARYIPGLRHFGWLTVVTLAEPIAADARTTVNSPSPGP